MNGKDILIGLGYIDHSLIGDAETTLLPSQPRSSRRPLLIAVAAALMLALVGCGVAYARGWFSGFFAERSGTPLNDKQTQYISENEQLIHVGSTQNAWTVELLSAMNDGSTAYLIFGISAPEGVRLEDGADESGNWKSLCPGNHGALAGIPGGKPLVESDNVTWSRIEWSFEDDGDSLPNTANFVLHFQPNLEQSKVDPFGADAQYHIHIENFVLQYQDTEYMMELLNGEYKGQQGVIFTPEEAARLLCSDILGEGVWDFTVCFADSQKGTELLTEPVSVPAYVYRQTGENMLTFDRTREPVSLSSFVLRPLGATVTFSPDVRLHLAVLDDEHIYAVMHDGSQIELVDWGDFGTGILYLNAQTPIVLEDVDHVLLADGTVIPVP